MHFTIVRVRVGAVFRHVLGQEVAPVAGGIDQHVGGGGSHGAIQNGLECLVARLAIFKAQVIAKDDELLRTVGDDIDDIRQVRQVGLVHFNQAQALTRVGIQASLDEGGLACATGARQQHIVGGFALHKLQGVALDLFLLAIDLFQISQLHGRHMAHRFQRAVAAAALAVAPGDGLRPIRRAQGLGQHRFDAGDELLSPLHQAFKFFIHFGIQRFTIKREQL